MSVPFIRPVRPEDFAQLREFARVTGGGMTNLPDDDKALRGRIAHAVSSFASGAREPGPEVYMMVLEKDGKVLGTTGVFASIGLRQGFINYKLIDEVHYSEEFDRTTRRTVLMPSHDFTGCAEVGMLFVSPDARGIGAGKLLARSRYLFIAQKPEIIADHICAELRGWRGDDGDQPFWESVGRNFFEMTFEEADLHNAAHGNQFIQDLMPRHPVYTVFLSKAARDCIGRPHKGAQPAYDMLIAEGFEWDNYVDIFDGGPLVDAKTSQIRTIRESAVKRLAATEDVKDGRKMLMAAGAVSSFRCIQETGRVDGDALVISKAAAKALNVKIGDDVRCIAW
ncbi:MAG TPA: arginine N-succinyltransferase [Parvularculaceae bacterium]|nr:arginine N-succinyltransferase [Parvularculaceae bacterium]HNS87705.1 arginine N-succinyltransferase [Parvularculaceae bacterium]